MPNQEKTLQILNKMSQLFEELKNELTDSKTVLPPPTISGTKSPPKLSIYNQDIVEPVENLDDFESLKKALSSTKWPEAVNPELICDPTIIKDKTERGSGIIQLLIEENLLNLNFLDIGCGEGFSTRYAASEVAAKAVGYDIKDYGWSNFESKPNLIMTTNFEEVKNNGPYNIILLFDVIDHSIGQNPVELLKMATSVLAENGKIYMRTHPFISRHGTHLYHELNKAYVHLVFTPEELKMLLPEPKYEEPTIKVVKPIKTYETFIENSGLNIIHKREIRENIEPFFKIPKIADRIIKNTDFHEFPEYQMQIQFVDYVLNKK